MRPLQRCIYDRLKAEVQKCKGSEVQMAFDWTQAANDMRAIRAENEVSVAIRRGDSTLSAQLMRIEYAGTRGFRLQSDAARQANQAVFILGEPDMNILPEDRLNYGSV